MSTPKTVAVLFADPKGAYSHAPHVDLWDQKRDARNYRGPHPVVAHPPCQAWSQMNRVNAARWGYVRGVDGGCFVAALDAVRKWGGVLEHPAGSLAFATHGIPSPSGGWTLTFDGDWITEVRQACYGHRATKRTWLLYHGDAPPPKLDWRRVRGSHQIGRVRRNAAAASVKRARSDTASVPRRAALDRAQREMKEGPSSPPLEPSMEQRAAV